MDVSLTVKYILEPVNDEIELAQAHRVRRQVFIIEQDVPESVEIDGFDDEAYHINCNVGDETVGTGRVLSLPEGGKIGRVAVLERYRGKGMGTAIVHHLIDHARAKGAKEIFANVQLDAVEFYEKLGFVGGGGSFMEGGIEHVRMVLVDGELDL